MFKNVASQKLTVLAFADAGHATLDAGEPVTGDAANISCKIEQDDDGTQSATNDVAPTEVEDGQYRFDLTQAETNGDKLTFYPESSTAGVQVVALPSNVIYTRPQYFSTLNLTALGNVGIDWANVENPTTALDLSGTDIQLVDTATVAGSVTGAVGSVTGAVGSVTGAVGSVAGNVDGNVTGSVGSLVGHTVQTGDTYADWADGGRLDLLLDRLITELDTARTEPTQGAPGVSEKLGTKIDYLYKAWRNRSTQTATAYNLYNDDATTLDHKSTTSDDGTTYDRGEVGSGA